MRSYNVRQATSDDIPSLMNLRQEAERWLAAAGIQQWSDPVLGEKAIQSWRDKIESGQTWVFTDAENSVSGTVSLGSADLDFWNDGDDPNSAVYVYKLIVSRAARGENLGARILDWVSTIAAAEGKQWIRLDVWRDNPKLQRYYEKHGFEHVRTERLDSRLSGWLGQRPAGTVLFPDLQLPAIPLAVPAQFANELTALRNAAAVLAQQSEDLFARFRDVAGSLTGPGRYDYQTASEHLYLVRGALQRAVDRLNDGLPIVAALPAPSNLGARSPER